MPPTPTPSRPSGPGEPTDHTVRTLEQLLATYPNRPSPVAVRKETTELTPAQAEIVRAAPFVLVATTGPQGIDVSPRGDAPGFVAVRNEHTLVVPDRPGNNRLDTLHNLLADPRVGLLFLVPGLGEELRVRGTATISTDPEELARHEVQGRAPASVLVVQVDSVFFQCARAITRSRLWDPDSRVARGTLPTAGRLALEAQAFVTPDQARAYDAGLAERQAATLW
jgi:PPOX class probable FMN-dependent enzyme